MKKKITYFNKCEHCGSSSEYISRDEKINSCITDGDILAMISCHAEKPFESRHCGYCGLKTLQKRTAWSGVLEEDGCASNKGGVTNGNTRK